MSTDPRIGTLIGGYSIEALLGRGGMGIVYLAHHERLDRKVALKVLAPELAEDEEFRSRFVRESRMAASLDHPNVIPVYDADEVDGLLYIAMRYVDGPDLKQVITAEGPLTAERTARVLSQVAGALAVAHERGLVHRDVKPANILMSRANGSAEHVYLTDFGLTKRGSSQSGYTATGAFVGTIDYIAPEQIEGKQLDGRTDIYALGCILYECLAGEPPFRKDAEVAVMYAHLMDPRPQVTAKNSGIPSEIDAVVATAMARDPGERYATATEFAAAMNAILGTSAASGVRQAAEATQLETTSAHTLPIGDKAVGSAAGAAAPPPRRILSPRALVAALATLLLVAAGGFYLAGSGEDRERPRVAGDIAGAVGQSETPHAYFDLLGRGLQRIALEPGADMEPLSDVLPSGPERLEDRWVTISANGDYLLLDTERADGCRSWACLAVVRGDELEAVQVGPELIHPYGWSVISGDGNTIVFSSDEGPHNVDLWAISRADIAWANKILLTEDGDWRFNQNPAFSPDEQTVLFDCHDKRYDPVGGAICEVGIDGTGFSEIISAFDGSGDTRKSYVRHGHYASDGSLVFEAYWGGYTQIFRYSEGEQPAPINPTFDGDTAPCTLADGRIASIYGEDVKLMSPDGVDIDVIELDLKKDEYLDHQVSCG